MATPIQVTHTIRTLDGRPAVGRTARIATVPARVWDQDDRLIEPFTAVSDVAGLVSMLLLPTSSLAPTGSYYTITVGGERLAFVVPDAGPVTVHDHLTTPDSVTDPSVLGAHLLDPAAHPAAFAAHEAGSVVAGTSFGRPSAVGTGSDYAREDHDHGTPSLGTTGTTAAAGNHNHAGVYDPAGTGAASAAAAVTAHEGAGNPHPTYTTDAEVAAAILAGLAGPAAFPGSGGEFNQIGVSAEAARSDHSHRSETYGAVDAHVAALHPLTSPAPVRKTANTARNTTTTLADDPHLVIAVAANAVYLISLVVFFDGPAGADLKLGWTVPAGATLDWSSRALPTSAASENTTIRQAALTVADAAAIGTLGAGTKLAAIPTGILIVGGTAGNLRVQWAQQNSDPADVTLFAPSMLRAERVA